MSSKLPPIPGVVMDRETLDRLAGVEQEIATFRGIRHLWANAAANHVEYIASKDDLVGEQGHRLRTVVYLALRLFTHAFPTHKSPHMQFCRFIQHKADEVPPNGDTVLVLVWTKILEEDEWVDIRAWRVGYHDNGWWDARSGGRISPLAWCELPMPYVED